MINSFSSHLPLYHKRNTIQNQTKTVNMSTNSNQKFLPKKKTKIIPSPSSSFSSLFHKFLQTQYRINVLNTVLFQSEFFVPVKVTPLFYYIPKFGLYRRSGQGSQYRFILASIAIIFRTGEQSGTDRPLFRISIYVREI